MKKTLVLAALATALLVMTVGILASGDKQPAAEVSASPVQPPKPLYSSAVQPGPLVQAEDFSSEGISVPSAPAGTAYIAATWGDDAVHFLDVNLQDLGGFSTGSNPNGIATDGTLIYVGSFTLPGVLVYDTNGVYQYQWTSSYCSSLQGMEYVSGALAVSSDPNVNFLAPATGALIRSIPSQGSTVEGLTFDGTALWQLADSIIATDPATGAVIRSIPNAALGCDYGGSGLAASGPNELTLGCASGQWYKVSSVDGTVIASGNNGLQMYGLKHVGTVQPAFDLTFLDDYGRSQVCVNSKTGAWQYNVLSGLWKGVYTGKCTVSKTSDRWTFRSVAGSPRLMLLTYYLQMFRATASLGGSDFVSQLSDRNTKDDPAGCSAK